MYSSDVSFQKRTRRTLRVRAPSGLPRHRWGLAPFCFWAQTSFPSYCPLYLLMVSSQTFCDQGDSGGASKFRSIEENVPPHRRVSGTNLRLPIGKPPARGRDGPAENSASTLRPDGESSPFLLPACSYLGGSERELLVPLYSLWLVHLHCSPLQVACPL
jgi:hypothetical protein